MQLRARYALCVLTAPPYVIAWTRQRQCNDVRLAQASLGADNPRPPTSLHGRVSVRAISVRLG